MSFKDILKQQQSGMEALATTGVIGLHLVSGPLVGFAIGYGLDYWLGITPWGKLIFLFIGIVAGFLNVYRDTRHLLKKMAAEDARRKGLAAKPDPADAAAAHAASPPGAAVRVARQTSETNNNARSEDHDARP